MYSSLGIDAKASREEVAAALQLKPGSGASPAILLDEEKRSAYDRAHETLKTIGMLRHRLGLDSGDSWFLETCPDFAPRSRTAKAPAKPGEPEPEAASPGANPDIAQAQGVKTRPQAHSRRLIPIIVGIIVVILLVLFIVYF